MMRDKIIRFLNNQLKVSEIADKSINGLQVDGNKFVNRVVTCVDADISSIKNAIELKADLMIVHHGLFWRNDETIVGPLYEKLSLLIKNNLSLYAVHLPLDIHEEFGNNILIARQLKLRNISKFAEYNGLFLGYFGESNISDINSFMSFVESSLNTKAKLFNFNKSSNVRLVGIVSGSGGFAIKDMHNYGIDTLVVGEANYADILLAKDLGINLIQAGHYETEVFGVRAIANKLNELFSSDGLECIFYDNKENRNFHL